MTTTATGRSPSATRAVSEALAAAPERLLHDWRRAYRRSVEYLSHLGVDEKTSAEIAQDAISRAVERESWEAGGDAYSEALRAMREIVVERYPRATAAGCADLDPFTAWRVAAAAGRTGDSSATSAPVASMPPILRGSMPRAKLERRFFRPQVAKARADVEAVPEEHETPEAADEGDSKPGGSARRQRRWLPWTRRAARRRRILSTLVLVPSILASWLMMSVLPEKGGNTMEMLIVVFFGLLFAWISIGFWTALYGFYTLLRREERFKIMHLPKGQQYAPIDESARTAIVMPICEEPVERVFAGLRAIQQSVDRTPSGHRFDFFVISDSATPETGIREEEAWLRWCRETGGFGRIFYRRRRIRLKRKSGNVADFCRRWGRKYRYMIMLDADSVMSGESLERLVQLMEAHPAAGMIQTAPSAVYRRSIFGRVQQFSGRAYGPMFTAGLHYWQLGDGQYWGHNTIIRIAPFMQHCGLPPLPGKPPLGGDILSHDFVEAALMGRAGWSIWLAYDLPGSFEETPSSMLEEMKRDRRWCQGNLQHVRLLFTEGLFGAHRALFLNGALSYVSALLWFSFLLLSTAEAIHHALAETHYFPDGRSLFPQWPVWRPDWAIMLLAVTGVVLFLPKVLSILLILFRGQARMFGGATRVLISVPIEIILSSLFAPIRMVFHTRFVITNLMGRTVGWKSSPREDAETSWTEAITHHGADTIFACIWAGLLFWLSPAYFWWVTPVVGALILSIPVSVLVSKIELGDWVRRMGFFVIPEEVQPPRELDEVDANIAAACASAVLRPEAWSDGFVMAVADPAMNAVHRSLLGPKRRKKAAIREQRRVIMESVLEKGPESADRRARNIILNDQDLIEDIHTRVWRCDDDDTCRRWGIG
ncbi:MAG TPA: glucans biosynthesis glucosyltransferase MdoH [Candidatus Limnocylindrales bacterium]|nr:glucans biosynthesis glucosyltransferase MdoH [Candidatus Limnocylindrales bacterium]